MRCSMRRTSALLVSSFLALARTAAAQDSTPTPAPAATTAAAATSTPAKAPASTPKVTATAKAAISAAVASPTATSASDEIVRKAKSFADDLNDETNFRIGRAKRIFETEPMSDDL